MTATGAARPARLRLATRRARRVLRRRTAGGSPRAGGARRRPRARHGAVVRDRGLASTTAFNALVRFLDEIDVAIVLDGFNEVIHLSDAHLGQQPGEHPWSAVWSMLARRPSADETVQRAELIALHRGARRAIAVVDRSILRRSTLAPLL